MPWVHLPVPRITAPESAPKRDGSAAPHRRVSSRRAFTLIELLVVIGIIVILVGILVPVLIAARIQSRLVACKSNLRQIGEVTFVYAHDNRGKLPPNLSSPSPGQFWYDEARLGRYFQATQVTTAGVAGGIFVCPADDTAVRSYAMNFWASSRMDPPKVPGSAWKLNSSPSSKLILYADAWSSKHPLNTLDWVAPPTVGASGTPGQRFGAGGGLPPFPAGRWGQVNCELPYMRHRALRMGTQGTAPKGRVVIGYADGHVAAKSESELAVQASGISTFDSLWTPDDRLIAP